MKSMVAHEKLNSTFVVFRFALSEFSSHSSTCHLTINASKGEGGHLIHLFRCGQIHIESRPTEQHCQVLRSGIYSFVGDLTRIPIYYFLVTHDFSS